MPLIWDKIIKSIHSGNSVRLVAIGKTGASIYGHFIPGSDQWNNVERTDFIFALSSFETEVRKQENGDASV